MSDEKQVKAQDMVNRSGKRITKAFDQMRAGRDGAAAVGRWPTVAAPARQRRHMPVQRALEWAFGVEHARLDFDATGVRAFDRVGVSPEWILQQTALIGCRVDGGGASAAHPDAELIAAAVEALPVAMGGRGMAAVVAACARAGVVPDWRGNARPRIVPLGWDLGEDGAWQAHTRVGEEYEFSGGQRQVRRGRAVYCPVRYEGGAASVSAARRAYLDWYGAVLHIAHEIGRPGYLSDIVLSGQMPPLSPWLQEII